MSGHSQLVVDAAKSDHYKTMNRYHYNTPHCVGSLWGRVMRKNLKETPVRTLCPPTENFTNS